MKNKYPVLPWGVRESSHMRRRLLPIEPPGRPTNAPVAPQLRLRAYVLLLRGELLLLHIFSVLLIGNRAQRQSGRSIRDRLPRPCLAAGQ